MKKKKIITKDNLERGGRIQQARVRAGMMMPANLAGVVGVSEWMVREWEKGSSRPRAARLRKVADVTGVAFDWLVDGTGPMVKKADLAALFLRGAAAGGEMREDDRATQEIHRISLNRERVTVYATREQGKDMVMTAEKLREDPRPDDLVGIEGAYGVVVASRGVRQLPAGATIYLNPLLPPLVGNFVLLRADGNRGMIGRLRDYDDDKWVLERDDGELAAPRAIWTECHVIAYSMTRLI